MEEWKEYNFTEIATIISGGTPKTSNCEYWDGDIPWLSVKDFGNDLKYVYTTERQITKLGLDNSPANILSKDDIILSARGTVGELSMIPFPMSFNQSCFGLRAKDIVDAHFLYYLMKTKVRELKNNSHGSVFDTITRATLDNLTCRLPSLNLQKQIARCLSTLDDKIELNRKINDNLEQQAQNIFNHYFIDNPMELGYYSEGVLTDIAVYLNGLAMQKFRPEGSDFGLPVLKIKELGQKSCDNNSDRCSSLIKEEYIVNDGDVIFSWSGTLLVDLWCGGKCGLNQHLFKVTSDTYPKWFYYFWTKHHLDNFIRVAKDKAVTMGHIKRTELEKANIIVPTLDKLSEINRIMSPIINEIINHRVEMRRLAQLRDSLLPQLMSGELKINEIDC